MENYFFVFIISEHSKHVLKTCVEVGLGQTPPFVHWDIFPKLTLLFFDGFLYDLGFFYAWNFPNLKLCLITNIITIPKYSAYFCSSKSEDLADLQDSMKLSSFIFIHNYQKAKKVNFWGIMYRCYNWCKYEVILLNKV